MHHVDDDERALSAEGRGSEIRGWGTQSAPVGCRLHRHLDNTQRRVSRVRVALKRVFRARSDDDPFLCTSHAVSYTFLARDNNSPTAYLTGAAWSLSLSARILTELSETRTQQRTNQMRDAKKGFTVVSNCCPGEVCCVGLASRSHKIETRRRRSRTRRRKSQEKLQAL